MGKNRFVFVITGHKTLSLTKQCIDSIRAQLGSFEFLTFYMDDCSNYSLTEIELLEKWLSQANGRLFSLKERHFQIGALSKGIPLIDSDNDIVCLVDSDDYLLPHALQTVNEAYQDPHIAMTYGNVLIDFRPYQDTQEKYFYDKKTVNTEYSTEIWEKQSFREDGFRCFHLRTFRRWLWNYIDPKGFRRPNGDFIRASGDSAYMFPILELLADPKHVAFIDTPLYVYRLHEGNVHNHDKKSQSDDLDLLRFKMKKYPPLDRSILRQHLERSKCVG
jgi:glycosyltransferase involved in cell wall biosynthesis